MLRGPVIDDHNTRFFPMRSSSTHMTAVGGRVGLMVGGAKNACSSSPPCNAKNEPYWSTYFRVAPLAKTNWTVAL